MVVQRNVGLDSGGTFSRVSAERILAVNSRVPERYAQERGSSYSRTTHDCQARLVAGS